MLPYEEMMALPPIETVATHTRRDTILYALGVGAGMEEPTSPQELPYIYEQQLVALPTMPLVLGYPGFFLMEPRYRVDWKKVLHGEQRLTLHRAVPCEGTLRSVLTFDEVYDKGADKGALLFVTRKLYDDASGNLIATLGSTSFLRGDGGCGGRTDKAPSPHDIPQREPDATIKIPTRTDQALLYRLSGDLNPLHVDPAVATSAGFDRPILHGLATFGIVGRALLRFAANSDAPQLTRLDGRFSSPVFPGETITVEIWDEGQSQVSVRALVAERDQTVLDHGIAEFAEKL